MSEALDIHDVVFDRVDMTISISKRIAEGEGFRGVVALASGVERVRGVRR